MYEPGRLMALVAVPATLWASLKARLDRLQEVKQIAQIAAAIGREFSFDLIAAVSQDYRKDLESALDRLVEAELTFGNAAPQGAVYTFKHALIQEVANDSMLKERRTQLHRHIAEVLEQKFFNVAKIEPEVLARHYALAGMVDKAIGYWRSAGEMATDASANVEAVNHFETAIDLLENLPEGTRRDSIELDLRIALGGPLLMTRGHGAPEVGETYARARTLSQKLKRTPQIVPALFGMWRF